jgi:hypothetical protein
MPALKSPLTPLLRLVSTRPLVSTGAGPAAPCAAALPNRHPMIDHRLSTDPPDLPRTGARHGAPLLGRRAFLARAATAALAICAPWTGAAAGARDTVYQRIWDADQAASGIPAIALDQKGDPARGFVRVDERGGREPEHRLFAEVQIPEHKRRTYELCKALFDNYSLDQSKPEDNRPEEAREILALLEAITDSPPMTTARAYLEENRGRSWPRDAWQELIFDLWFRQFDDGRNRDLSGFEHVAVGEQKGGRVNGHHFWYGCFPGEAPRDSVLQYNMLVARHRHPIDYRKHCGNTDRESYSTSSEPTSQMRWSPPTGHADLSCRAIAANHGLIDHKPVPHFPARRHSRPTAGGGVRRYPAKAA